MNTSRIAIEQGERLKQARLSKANSNPDLKNAKKTCENFGWNYATYYDHETGRNRLNSAAAKYAKAFGVTESWLITGEGETPEPIKLAVYGYAAGSFDGYNILHHDAMEFIDRPKYLQNIDEAYAVRVRGDSMMPRFFDGDPLFVHPRQAPSPTDAIIIQVYSKTGQPEVYVKEYVREQHDLVICKQYNPEKERIFEKKNIMAMHRVISNREIYG